MKIYYAAGNRIGSRIQMERCLSHLSNHIIKTSGYFNYTINNIDWILDPLFNNPNSDTSIYKYFGGKANLGVEKIVPFNLNLFKSLLKDVEDFGPDLVISDGEPISGYIAVGLGIKLWYCSPIFAFSALEPSLNYICYNMPNDEYYYKHLYLSEPDKIFVYSPFLEIDNFPDFKKDANFIRPYHINATIKSSNNILLVSEDSSRLDLIKPILKYSKYGIDILNPKEENYNIDNYSTIISTGETSYIADALYNYRKLYLSPTIKDLESVINSVMSHKLNAGTELGQFELMEYFALEYLDDLLNKTEDKSIIKINNNIKYLHEELV